MLLLDEVVQQLAKGRLRIDRAEPLKRLIGPHDNMLAPGATVLPQQPVTLGGNLAALELQRVLAVQLLGVDELANNGQDADALVETAIPEDRRDSARIISPR